MAKKILAVQHHLDDYECMWNGIEDLYIRDTGEALPPSFFFSLSSFGSFCYRKTPKSALKRMVSLGDGRTKQMYRFLAPIAGFTYKHYEYQTFEQALTKAKAEIDAGYPIVLGALDMYYLPYFPKLYHGDHIPFHYVLMIGYDEAAQCIDLLDCARQEAQTLPLDALRQAWDCGYPGLSKPNTVCTIRMNATKNKCQIAKEALATRGEMFLHPPVNFVGKKGFEKFIHELPQLKSELTKEEYDKLLENMVTFFGTVPTVPNALRGIDAPDEVAFCGGFDKMSRILDDMGQEYNNKAWLTAAAHFQEGAAFISEITNIIVAYLTGKRDGTHELPGLFTNVMDIMEDQFVLLGK
ncbi:MAG: BtrH N-terminal domain-containing protein [Eubacteriales bacterium]|nr:BtrH N-terminal domain-containing protein [Eubacteriales bacterium]